MALPNDLISKFFPEDDQAIAPSRSKEDLSSKFFPKDTNIVPQNIRRKENIDEDLVSRFFGREPQQELPDESIEQEIPSLTNKIADYFSSGKLGEAATLQMKSGGFAGAPAATGPIAKRVSTEVGTMAAVEAAFAPLIGAAASSVAPKFLEALTRLTQAGATGAATATTTKLVEEGELPSQEEILEHGLEWMAIDGIMQGLHLAASSGKTIYDFGKAVNKIAKEEKVPATQVLKNLWSATKNYIRQRFGRNIVSPDEIFPSDVELLVENAKKIEETLEVPSVKEEGIPKVKEESLQKEPTVSEIQPIESKAELPKLEAEVIEEDLPVTFKTEKGSTYEVSPDGSTTRTKFPHPGHTDEGLQPKSDKTYYLTDSQAKTLSEIKAKGPSRKITETPDGSIGIQYDKGAHKGKFEKRTIVTPKTSPEKGLIPLETWKDGKFHFGNKITEVKAPLSSLKEKPLVKKITQPVHPKAKPRQPVLGKKQAVARSKIVKLLSKAFKDPVRLGKIGQRNAAGIHKMWPRVTRLLQANDIETLAHEIGHNLHTVLYGGNAKTPTEQSLNVSKALRPYLDELKPLAQYEPFGMEGFAEFTRLYVTNPEAAKELAPKFYDKFEADLDSAYPELKNALLESRDYYDQYLQGTPQSRIRAQTDYRDDSSKLKNIIDWVKNKGNLDHLKTQFLDDVFPAKRLVAEAFGIPTTEVENLKDERNLYRSLRVLKGAIGKGDVFVLHETFDAKTLNKINGSLRDILKQLPDEDSYREFNDYLIARRTTEKTGQGVETGINFGDAILVERELRGKYAALAAQLDKYNDSLLKYAKDSGLLSDEQYRAIKEKNVMYAPFQRVMEKDKRSTTSVSSKIQAGRPIKRMKGSTRDIIPPIESVLKNTYSIIINAEKNLAGQTLSKLAQMKGVGAYVEHVPTPIKLKGKVERAEIEKSVIKHLIETGQDQFLDLNEDGKISIRRDLEQIIPDVIMKFGAGQYPAGENIITVYFDGKPTYYEVTPELFEMWTKGTAPYTANILTKIMRIPARTLRAGAILNPRFMQKNIIRDTWGSWLFTKYGKSIKDPTELFMDTVYSPIAMLGTAAKKGPLYVEWMKSGGGMSTMQSMDRDNIIKKLDEVRNGYKPQQVLKWLRLVAEWSEEANRLAEFGRALEVEGQTRLGKEIAAFAARDLSIDFAKMGMQTKALNQIIPFFNATIQGGDKLLRSALNAEDRKSFIPRILGFIVLPSLILAWLNKDDERVKEFYEEEKDFNFVTFLGDTAIKIPVPFETGVMAHGLTQRMFNFFMKKDPEAFEGFMGSIMSAMLPNFIPAIANPLIETAANKNFFTGARLIRMGKEGLISKYQYKTNTSVTSRLIGRAMSYMLGQETRSKAASPIIIDHFINSWGAGLGRTIVSISDLGLEASGLGDKIPKPDSAITDTLGLDGLTAKYPRASTRSIEKFYDNYQDATAKQRSFKHAKKMDLETTASLEAAYKRFDKMYDYPQLQAAYKAMQSSQKAINNIYNSPDIDSKTKREMIDDLYLQQIEFCKAVNESLVEHRRAKKAE